MWNVEKKQLNVLFLQIVVDIHAKYDYYWVIVIHKSSKRVLGKFLDNKNILNGE